MPSLPYTLSDPLGPDVTVTEFGVTPEDLRAIHFPYLADFSTASQPSRQTVVVIIDEEAASLEGQLFRKAIVASSITENSAAYLQCARQLRRMAAVRVMQAMTAQDPQLAQTWQRQNDDWFAKLEDHGTDFLGSGVAATSSSNPVGPTTHISEYNLTMDSADDMSTVVPRLRRDDEI